MKNNPLHKIIFMSSWFSSVVIKDYTSDNNKYVQHTKHADLVNHYSKACGDLITKRQGVFQIYIIKKPTSTDRSL